VKDTTRFACASLFFFAAVVLAVGCGGKQPPKNFPVSGTITMDDQPVTSGQVSFIPASDKQAPADLSAGKIENGQYKIFTGGKEGAPLGSYKVTVTPSMVPPQGGGAPPQLPANYSDPSKTVLKIEVVENPSAGAYDLKLKK
jgi:hypothetical protein